MEFFYHRNVRYGRLGRIVRSRRKMRVTDNDVHFGYCDILTFITHMRTSSAAITHVVTAQAYVAHRIKKAYRIGGMIPPFFIHHARLPFFWLAMKVAIRKSAKVKCMHNITFKQLCPREGLTVSSPM